MTSDRGIGLYRGLLRCYPRSFRDEYGPDMVLLFSEQLSDEPTLRVWGRGIVDLAITVPTLHLEAHMKRPANSLTPLLFAAVATAGALVALIGGTNRGLMVGGLAVAAIAGVLGVRSWQQTRTITAAGSITAQWWKLLAIGVGALFAMMIAEGATDISLWMPMVITVLFALLLIAAGFILGLAHLITTHSRSVAS